MEKIKNPKSHTSESTIDDGKPRGIVEWANNFPVYMFDSWLNIEFANFLRIR